jgi:hypothetical protein
MNYHHIWILILVLAPVATAQWIDPPTNDMGPPAPVLESIAEPMVKDSAEQSAPNLAPLLRVARPQVELGALSDRHPVTLRFELSNDGTDVLEMYKVVSSCRCAVAQLKQAEILPGESIPLEVTFDTTGLFGAQRRTLEIHTNDPTAPVTPLVFTGHVQTPYRLVPSAVQWTRVVDVQACRRDEPREMFSVFSGRQGAAPVSVDVRFEEAHLSAKIEPVHDGSFSGMRIAVRAGEGMPAGPFAVNARVAVGWDDTREVLDVLVRGTVVDTIAFHPTQVPSLAEVAPGEDLRMGRIVLRSAIPDRPFRIRRVESGFRLNHRVDTLRDGHEYAVSLTAAANARPGSHGETLTILTDDPQQPAIVIPVFMQISSPIKATPAVAYLEGPPGPDPITQSIILQGTAGPFRIEGISTSSPIFEVAQSGSVAATSHTLTIRLAQSVPVGEHAGLVTIHTNQPTMPEVAVRVFAVVEETRDNG